MKNLSKIVENTEFIVQEKTGGWEGWNIYARHKIFSKYSVSVIRDKKPRLTKKIKEMIVSMAIEEMETDKHNDPLNQELMAIDHRLSRTEGDFTWLIRSNDNVFSLIEKCLIQECEYKEVNQTLQRLLDMKSEFDDMKKVGSQIKKRTNRTILGTKE